MASHMVDDFWWGSHSAPPNYIAFKTILNVVSEHLNVDDLAATNFAQEYRDFLHNAALFAAKVILYIYRTQTNLLLHPLLNLCQIIAKIQFLNVRSRMRLVTLMKKVLLYSSPDVISSYIDRLIGSEDGILFHHRDCPDNQIFMSIVEIYRNLLAPKNVKCLQESYRLVIAELRYCFEVLQKEANVNCPNAKLDDWDGADPTLWSKGSYSVDYASSTISYLCSTFDEFVNAKNSLIGMWALTPNFFYLLTSLVPISEEWFYALYPAAHYSIVYTLKSHEFFITNSEILQSLTPNLMYSNQTGKYFGKILDVLADLFSSNQCCYDTISLCLQFFGNVLDRARKLNNALVFKNGKFRNVCEATVNLESKNFQFLVPV
uniref:Uncharacterized protein n=1 Tax=Romanomermis culicivorax TaxID=13658 RepID=A0A915JAK9_ROMCU